MRQPMKVRASGLLLRAAVFCMPLVFACENATEPPVPTTLEAFDGASQSGVAGGTLAIAPSVRVLDQHGRPMAGVRVPFTVIAGEGSVSEPEPVSDAKGIASAGSWTLGVHSGENTLAATLGGVGAVSFSAIARAGDPASVDVVAGQAQTGVVATILPSDLVIVVRDAHANPVAGVSVDFSAGDDGDLTIVSGITDGSGRATARWTLGTKAGIQSATAAIGGGASTTFDATALAGEPATVGIVEGDGQAAVVGTPVEVPPAVVVRDTWGNAVSGVDIQFEVLPGSGKVDAAQSSGPVAEVETDGQGIARLARWVLGTRAGLNTLKITAGGRSVTVVAVARAGAPRAIQKIEGDAQSAPVNQPLPIPPAVRVLDEFQNSVPGAIVKFTVGAGGGTIDLTEVTADSTGTASPGTWRMGAATGSYTLTAEAAGVTSTVTFAATATPATSGGGTGGGTGGGGSGGSGGGGGGGGGSMNSTYDLDVRLTGSISGTQAQAFYMAAGRWASVIAGDLPDVTVSIPANGCGIKHAAINETVDDLIILVEVVPIDGPGNILGAAGPCFIRSVGGLPVVGAMRLDEADVAFLEANGKLQDVVAHEIGHIIGFGTRWGGVLVGGGGGDPYFAGPEAVADFKGAGGSAYPGTPVPVENTGGPGTRDGHWRESIFQNELMTGWLDMGENPLSSITVSSLADIGYVVNMGGADAFSLSLSAAATAQGTTAPPSGFRIQDLPLSIVPIAVDSRGRRAPLTGVRR
jgi:Bacterial Ig-like domain (group 1)/Leishmanolysin